MANSIRDTNEQTAQRRNRRRAAFGGEVRVDVDDRTVTVDACDVSTGGIGVRIDETFDVGAHVTVDFTVPGSGRVCIDAEVAWTDGNRAGLRFRRLGPSSLSRLMLYVAE